MENQEKKTSLPVRIFGDVCGVGAGLLVGSVALSVVDSFTGMGKIYKYLLKAGAIGLEYTTIRQVRKNTISHMEETIESVDKTLKLWTEMEHKTKPVQVEAKVE